MVGTCAVYSEVPMCVSKHCTLIKHSSAYLIRTNYVPKFVQCNKFQFAYFLPLTSIKYAKLNMYMCSTILTSESNRDNLLFNFPVIELDYRLCQKIMEIN